MDARKPIPETVWVVAGLTVLASTGIGFVLGGLSGALYFLFGAAEEDFNGGWMSGIVLGLLAGVAYVMLLVQKGLDATWDGRFVWRATVAGAVTGLLAAVGVHVVIILELPPWVLQPFVLQPLGIGALFGIVAGAILGAISSALFCLCFKTQRADAGGTGNTV